MERLLSCSQKGKSLETNHLINCVICHVINHVINHVISLQKATALNKVLHLVKMVVSPYAKGVG